jgi:hypothetical protein
MRNFRRFRVPFVEITSVIVERTASRVGTVECGWQATKAKLEYNMPDDRLIL